jgi:predicted DNA-binding transcriptional regulator YafY
MPIPMKVKLSTEKGLSHDTLAYRLSEVLTKLNQGESLDPKALADEFGVNLRTIQRDLNVRFAGLPLIKASGRYKMDEAHLGKLSIRDIERFAAFSGVSGLFPEMSGQFLKEVFASNAHDAWLVKGHHYEDVREHRAMFVSLEQAIVEKHTVQFRYSKTNGDTRVRSAVEPYKLINQKGIWYLAAWNDGKLKSFAISRMEALMVDEATFVPRNHVEKELADSDGIWLGAVRHRVLIQVSSQVASFFRRRNLLPNQVIEKEAAGGDILVSTTVSQAEEVLPIIRYWIPHVRILEPIAMQQQLEESLATYLEASRSPVK